MPLPRVQSFEFNDLPWVPAALRDTIVESLSQALRWGKVIDGLVDPFERFLDRAGTREVLDLGSGAGAPASILAAALAKRGRDVTFLLTDLFPRIEAWERLRRGQPEHLTFVPEPVDATAIAPEASRGRARAILNVLHHLPPELAASLIGSAVRDRAPLFIAEGFERNPLGFLPIAFTGLPALIASPIAAPNRRLLRILLTWLTPVALAVSAWDGFVSTLRVYTEAELRQMAAAAPGGEDYTWEYGRYAFPMGGRGYYFMGWAGGPEQRPGAMGSRD
jgi:SAM-dependent methyltransferase